MRGKIFTLVLSVGVILTLFFVFKGDAKITNFPSNGKTIVAFGDSLVEGVGATENKDFVSLLSREIKEPIINLGVSGETSAKGLERIREVNDLDPKVVLVLFGGNDFLRKVPIEETFRNLDKIITRLHAEGAVVIVLGVRGGLLTDKFDERFEELAENRGALYVSNVLDGLLTHNEFMSDSIHPNDLGYEKIAKRIAPVLEKALGK